jgi:hypothetical protein
MLQSKLIISQSMHENLAEFLQLIFACDYTLKKRLLITLQSTSRVARKSWEQYQVSLAALLAKNRKPMASVFSQNICMPFSNPEISYSRCCGGQSSLKVGTQKGNRQKPSCGPCPSSRKPSPMSLAACKHLPKDTS